MHRLCPVVLVVFISVLTAAAVPAADDDSPPKSKGPLLRVDTGGPVAFVTSMAFDAKGETLYAGGWDKVIRRWKRNKKGKFQLSPLTFRVPVGPGTNGAINALALSADGTWLAAAGNGMARQVAGYHDLGFIVPSVAMPDPKMRQDIGTIYLFNTSDRSVRLLRGHEGYVVALTFGPPQPGKDIPPLLSVAVEDNEKNRLETQLTARLWDANNKEKPSLAVLSGLPSKALDSPFPGVALWQDAAGGPLRAALALHDGKLRIWEFLGGQGRLREFKDVPQSLCVAHLGRSRLLTVGYDADDTKRIRLARWQSPAKGEPKQDWKGELASGVPCSMGLLSMQADDVPDLAAVLLRLPVRQGVPQAYRLRLADLNHPQLQKVRDIKLWDDAERQPPVATSLRGKLLAVANNADHSIRVYTLSDLMDHDDKPTPQILRGDTVFFRRARFVQRGGDVGLRLEGDRGAWILNISKRSLTDDQTDWKIPPRKAHAWKVERQETRGGREQILVRHDNKLINSIVIPETERLTFGAFFPPGEKVDVPLLALATHDNGQPRLGVYNANSGEQLREFTGHTERLNFVTFSSDGRLLVSTAEDGKVCVWSLTDLDTVFRKHGRLPGLVVEEADKGVKGVRALKVEEDSPVRGKVKRGDVLVGLVPENNKPQAIDSPRAFYLAVYEQRPGTTVRLRRGDLNGKDDIPFVVGQGADERKPLFSFVAVGKGEAAECQWIGWSPLGHYDRSSQEVEKYLGWHFNTGEKNAPTRFVEASEYRKNYYRENLLRTLIREGDPHRVQVQPLPHPVLVLRGEDAGRPLRRDDKGVIVVRQPKIELTVRLDERPLSSLSGLTWKFDRDAEKSVDLNRLEEAFVRIQVPPLKRGEHTITVQARPWENAAQPAYKTLILRYQPLPPEMVMENEGQSLHVREKKFTLKANIIPKVSGERVLVTIHKNGKKEHEKPLGPGKKGIALPLEQVLELSPGHNSIVVSAQNEGALDSTQETTTSPRLQVDFIFDPKPPLIAFQKIVSAGESKSLERTPSMVVHQPKVSVFGEIEAKDDPLTEATWDLGEGTPAAKVRGFAAGKQKMLSFEQPINLKLGPQVLRIRARTMNGKQEVERHLDLTYQPLVPFVTRITTPGHGEIVFGQEETKKIPVRARVKFPEHDLKFKARILVNGKPTDEHPVLNREKGTLEGTAVLEPGIKGNRIWIEMSNEWGAYELTPVIEVSYLRPPMLVGRLVHKPGREPSLVDLEIPVESIPRLDPKSVQVVVNDKPYIAKKNGEPYFPPNVVLDKGKKNRWMVNLTVRLDADKPAQKIVVRLANDEAPCPVPAEFTIPSAKVFPPPEAEFLQPRQDEGDGDPHLTIRFRVRSVAKLESVRLLRNQDAITPYKVIVGRVGEQFELMATAKLVLEPGENRLSIDAISVHGRYSQSPQLIRTYTPPPIEIVIDKLTEKKNGNPVGNPQYEEGTYRFDKVASGRVWLHGRIRWNDAGKNASQDSFYLRAFVNGFQQDPHWIQRKPNVPDEPFRIPLLLNLRKDNRIRLVAIRQEKPSWGKPTEALVDCNAPITALRLHVLALSPVSSDEEIEKRLQKTIDDLGQPRGDKPPIFQKVEPVRTLTGIRFDEDYLNHEIDHLRGKISQAAQELEEDNAKPMNEILMIYCEGMEKMDDKEGNLFVTPANQKASALRCSTFADYLKSVPGAHVLLLDVSRTQPPPKEKDPRDKVKGWGNNFGNSHPHVVVMRWARSFKPGRNPVQLIPVLEKQLPQADELSDLINRIDQAFKTDKDRDLLGFDKWLPDVLTYLKIR